LHGTKGSFIKTKSDVQETMLLAGHQPSEADWGVEPEAERGLLHTEKDGVVLRETVPSENGNYLDYYEGIYNAIRNGAVPPVTAEEGLAVIAIIEAAFKSVEQKGVVAL
jgi:predicted dehydrogenase